MKNTRLWIADPLVSYVEAFTEYVSLKKSHLFQVRACTDQEQLKRMLDEEETEILLITAKWYEAYREKLQGKCVVLLSEGSLPRKLAGDPSVYKYQSAENILREVMYYYSEQDGRELCPAGMKRENQVIGVYSPVDELSKNAFALTLGQIVGEKKHVLYLNLEECPGLNDLMGDHHWNMADLIYFLRQNKSNFLYRLNSMVQKCGSMDYIPACESYVDFCQITVKEWGKLLHLIRSQSTYDVVILDMGTSAGHALEILRQCDGIYVPVKQDLISKGKVDQWERYVQILDGMDILELAQKLELPPDGTGLTDKSELFMLSERDLGKFIRDLLKS